MRPWYQRTWVIILAFIFFFPLGILLLFLRLRAPSPAPNVPGAAPKKPSADEMFLPTYTEVDIDGIPASGEEAVSAHGSAFEIKPVLTDKRFVSYNTNLRQRHPGFYKVADFTVIDFETANMYPDSVCQMGIAVVKNGKVSENKCFNIRPPYDEFTNTKIHGIALDDVINENTFAELWPEIKPYIENQLIAAYNLSFDIGCLEATLANYNIPVPNYACFDILDSARTAFSLENHKLKTVAKFKMQLTAPFTEIQFSLNMTAKTQWMKQKLLFPTAFLLPIKLGVCILLLKGNLQMNAARYWQKSKRRKATGVKTLICIEFTGRSWKNQVI